MSAYYEIIALTSFKDPVTVYFAETREAQKVARDFISKHSLHYYKSEGAWIFRMRPEDAVVLTLQLSDRFELRRLTDQRLFAIIAT